jgi:hypothetical protein
VKGERMERLVNICEFFGADTFYEGAAGKSYMDVDSFSRRGIQVEFQDYRHPTYPQIYGEFVSHLSVIDLLFNQGDDSMAILTGQTG